MVRFQLVASVSVIASLISAGGAPAATTQKTGQAVQVELSAPGNFAIKEERVYQFNDGFSDVTSSIDGGVAKGAGTFYDNAWNGRPAVAGRATYTNGNAGSCAYPTITAPAAPPADASKVAPNGWANSKGERCAFYRGGDLSSTTYTQTLTASASCTYTQGGQSKTATKTVPFEYTYNITPKTGVNPVNALTAYYLVQVNNPGGSSVHVNVLGNIAAESAMIWKSGYKYSFGLLNSDGTSRVNNLLISMDGGAAASMPHTIEYPIDFKFAVANGGQNGNVSLIAYGDARGILNGDGFAGNDNGGAAGDALARASIGPASYDLGAGDHSAVVTGIVKNVSTTADITFTVNTNLSILDASNCH